MLMQLVEYSQTARPVFELTTYYHRQQTVSQTKQTTCRLRIERVELQKNENWQNRFEAYHDCSMPRTAKITESPNAARGDKLSEDHR